jgi:Trk K+ transport system NAD-binding subunit
MTRAIVAGSDPEGVGEALEAAGADVTRVESPVFAEALSEAGIEAADVFVLTDLEEGISVTLAKEANPEVEAVCYGAGELPESVKGMVDLVVDPALLSADAVAEELVR